MKDFTPRPEPPQFTIYGELYTATPDLSVDATIAASAFDNNISVSDPGQVEQLLEFFDLVLVDESAKRFRDGVQSKERTIGVRVMTNVMSYLVEELSGRPTPPSSPSPDSSPGDDGTPSTAGAPAEASTP